MKSPLPVLVFMFLAWTTLFSAQDKAHARELARVTLSPGWATFGMVVPQGAATSALQVGDLPTQTDVKNRWPDQSLKFAVVTCKVTTAGQYAVTAAAAGVSQPFAPQVPRAAVNFAIGDQVHTASLPSDPAPDNWLSGALVREWRWAVAPVNASNTPHPMLLVLFDVRTYNDGTSRLDVTVENDYDLSTGGTLRYGVDVDANGRTVFHRDRVEHWLFCRWRKVFSLGASLSEITDDFEPAFQAKALPRFLPDIANIVNTAQGTKYDILRAGSVDPCMPACGGRGEMAPFPDWTIYYLAHKNQAQKRYVLAEADLSASWPIHLREPQGPVSPGGALYKGIGSLKMISIDERPNFWLDNRAPSADRPAPDPSGWEQTGYFKSVAPLLPDNAHQPSLAYIPYLMTGDRFYCDEMASWAAFSLVKTYNEGGSKGARGGSKGHLAPNETRGFAWALRNLVDAAAYTPDAETALKAYFSQKVQNNLDWCDAYAASEQQPLGTYFVSPANMAIPYGGAYAQLAYAIDRARQQGFKGGLALRDGLARFQLKLFTSEPDFPKSYAMGLWMTAGPVDSKEVPLKDNHGKNIWHRTLKELFVGNYGNAPANPRANPGDCYGPWVRLSLVIALDNRWPGAKAAYDYNWSLVGTGRWWKAPEGCSNIAYHAGWAILPETLVPTQAETRGKHIGERSPQ